LSLASLSLLLVYLPLLCANTSLPTTPKRRGPGPRPPTAHNYDLRSAPPSNIPPRDNLVSDCSGFLSMATMVSVLKPLEDMNMMNQMHSTLKTLAPLAPMSLIWRLYRQGFVFAEEYEGCGRSPTVRQCHGEATRVRRPFFRVQQTELPLASDVGSQAQRGRR